ncbi:hypothetical protein ENKNEFLB_01941 [Nocardioides aquaticus]|uniref:Helix-turn-helix domain-containing protein n=1 Tax=Nocardioides aquaticus TaxID=160826 RepID=A0ABX8EGC7_9ACTN|nr:hypothetical protein [Nocardioides aquaticus]QVT79558.1 hypothetical protein ENKNEFLB_01941 [Nocardioides aquaticus]
MSRRFTVDQWRAAVYREPHITDATRVLLLYLSDYMRDDLTVSVDREQIAADLGRSERRIGERFRDALGQHPRKPDAEQRCRLEHRLLDRKARGQKHVRAVFQAVVPDVLSATHVCPAEDASPDSQQDAQEHPENDENRPAEKPYSGSQQDPRGSCLIRADPAAGPTRRDVGRDERAEDQQARGSVTECSWHDETHPCPDDCANHPDARRRIA